MNLEAQAIVQTPFPYACPATIKSLQAASAHNVFRKILAQVHSLKT